VTKAAENVSAGLTKLTETMGGLVKMLDRGKGGGAIYG
jgi:hypothetical protein